MHPIVILGTGLAGYSLARELRKLAPDQPLMLITGDDGRSYSKPMLSNAFAQGKNADQLAMADAARMAAQLKAEILTHTRVTTIDSAAHVLTTGDKKLPYSRLVLALGAEPIRLPLSGDGAEDVLQVNSLEDYARFRAHLQDKRHVAIIGAGLIGCEFANDLIGAGFGVTVMGLGATPLDNLIPPAAGMDLHQGLATSGVVWRLGASAQSVERTASGYRVTLDQGSPVEADLVLSAIGLRPALGLARAAGIEVNRGIVTDALLATSAPDIFALGDCAEVEGQVRLFVLPLMQGARALAQTLAGAPTPVRYPVMPVVIKTPARPVVIASGRGDWHCAAVAAGVRCEQRKDGQMTGFCLTGAAVAEKQALTATLSQQSAAAA